MARRAGQQIAESERARHDDPRRHVIAIDERAVWARAGIERPPYAVQQIDSLCALYDGSDRRDQSDERDGSHQASGASLFAHTPAGPEHDDRGQQDAGRCERVVRRDGDGNPGEIGRRQDRREPQRESHSDRVGIDRSNELDRHRHQLHHACEDEDDQRDVERAVPLIAGNAGAHGECNCEEQARCRHPDPRVDPSSEERDPREHHHQPDGGRRIGRATPRSIGRNSSCTCSRNIASNSTCSGRCQPG